MVVMLLLLIVVITGLALAAGLAVFSLWTARRIEALVPPVGRFVSVKGIRLHYLDQGSGPVVLMIHGLASQLQTFTFALSTRLPGYRLVILDRPGAGYSQAAPSAGLGAQADIVMAFLQALRIDRALLVGHSLGGAVSLAVAVDHPDCVAGLALLAPATQSETEPPEALRGLAIRSDILRWIVGWTLAIPASLRNGAQTTTLLFGPDPVPRDFNIKGGGLLPLRPWVFRNASRDLAAAAADLEVYATRHREIEKPVGVLFGTGDRVLDYRRHGQGLVGQIADLDLELIDQGGHMVPLSAPDRAAAFIARMARKAGMAPEATDVTATKTTV